MAQSSDKPIENEAELAEKNTFDELKLSKRLIDALNKKGYREPTPIQNGAIPIILRGEDLLATAQTGTGKTASFSLPLLHILSENNSTHNNIRALILTPTRELAEQIDKNIKAYASYLKLKSTVLVGGVSTHAQIRKLKKKPEIIVATPGRLIDLMERRLFSLKDIEFLVLDEADRMLDMGFIPDIRKVVSQTPKERQTLLFSATMSSTIAKLAEDILLSPKRLDIAPSVTTAENLDQSVFFVEQEKKFDLLKDTLKKIEGTRVLVFTRTKFRANKVAEKLSRAGIPADAIHSNKSQGARRRILAAFDSGKVNVLVATDVVARGIDVKEISHVINFELPDEAENYVHRIGRSARAKQSGTAYTFCNSPEVGMLQLIERTIKQKIDIEEDHPFHSEAAGKRYLTKQSPINPSRGNQGQRRRKKPSTKSGGSRRRSSESRRKFGKSKKSSGTSSHSRTRQRMNRRKKREGQRAGR